jgi:lysozyme family protein
LDKKINFFRNELTSKHGGKSVFSFEGRKMTEVSIRLRDLKPEYQKLWQSCQIKSDQLDTTKQIVAKIALNRDRYLAIAQKINVPWYFIAVIHNMESSLSFSKHLHNGDSLKKRTVNVPEGRPVPDPIHGWDVGYTWEESAIDALTKGGKDLDKVKDWSLPAQLWQIEQYNGFGYRLNHPDVLTPYLWSGTNLYTKGKFISDKKWDANAVSEQTGAAALLKILMQEENITILMA